MQDDNSGFLTVNNTDYRLKGKPSLIFFTENLYHIPGCNLSVLKIQIEMFFTCNIAEILLFEASEYLF